MDIDSNCPHLLSEEALFNIIFFVLFNVENSIKREMRKNCFSKKKNSTPPPPPPIFIFFTPIFFFFFFSVGNSMKREENLKF